MQKHTSRSGNMCRGARCAPRLSGGVHKRGRSRPAALPAYAGPRPVCYAHPITQKGCCHRLPLTCARCRILAQFSKLLLPSSAPARPGDCSRLTARRWARSCLRLPAAAAGGRCRRALRPSVTSARRPARRMPTASAGGARAASAKGASPAAHHVEVADHADFQVQGAQPCLGDGHV